MLNLFKVKKGQAAIELAIIGSLIILAFSYLITFTAKVNMRQEHLQNVFRNLLNGAATAGQSHAIATAFQRTPNIMDPYSPGTFTPVEASGKILWSSGQARGDTEVNAEWRPDHMTESGTYHKTFTRTEQPGGLMETSRTVDYGGMVRQGP